MEVETVVSFSRQELYALLESVPDSQKSILEKISAALGKLEMPIPVYGNGVTIRPRENA